MTITNGYCTEAEFLDYIASYTTGTSQSQLAEIAADNRVIDQCINSASRELDRVTGRVYYAVTGTYYFDTPDGYKLFLDKDFQSVISVANGDGTAISASAYNLLPLNDTPKYAIELKPGSGISWETDSEGNTRGAITVVGVTGDTLTDELKIAVLIMAVTLYRQRKGEAALEGGFVTQYGSTVFPAGIPKTAMQYMGHKIKGYMK